MKQSYRHIQHHTGYVYTTLRGVTAVCAHSPKLALIELACCNNSSEAVAVQASRASTPGRIMSCAVQGASLDPNPPNWIQP